LIDPAVLSRVKNAVCAVGCLAVPLEEYERNLHLPLFQVVGTGFLVRGTTVMTNRHVIAGLVSEQLRLGVPSSQLFLSFPVPDPSGHLRVTLRMIRRHGVLATPSLDVGFIEFAIVHPAHFEGILPLTVLDVFDCRISEEIAVIGYPYGTAMLERNGRIYRWGPVLQQGWISAVSPFETWSIPDEILLDVRTAGGMSGAPVFRTATGEVLGIHHSGWEATTALAQPLTRTLLSAWLAAFDGDRPSA
jgi:hypothetical protein